MTTLNSIGRLLALGAALCLVSCHAERRNEGAAGGPSGAAYEDCVDGDLDACHRYGMEHRKGTRAARRSSLVAFQYACFLDHAPSCERVAEIYGGDEIASVSGRVVEALEQACDGGEMGACVKLGDQLPARQARRLYESACDADHAVGCARLASSLRSRWRYGDHLRRALDLEEKACELGSVEGCMALGQAYLFGSGVAADPERGLDYLERSCTPDVGVGCELLTRIFERGMGVEPDNEKARKYRDLAASHSTENVAESPQTAFIVFAHACSRQDMLGCFNAGWLLAEGRDVERNITTSREFFERACENGLDPACSRWEELEASQPERTRIVR